MDKFEDVVGNAFDFLERSIAELTKGHTKYSVIHFYSAVELFMKARLLKEHWSLIVQKPENADRTKFLVGDFQSVGLEAAAGRLARVLDEGLSKDELQCFDNLRKHRNQMVHFTHDVQGSSKAAEIAIERVVAEQAKGWFYLRRLLVERWKDHFGRFGEIIQRIDAKMREQASYLKAKFGLMADDIKARRAAGVYFIQCPSCHFDAYTCEVPTSISDGECLVCGLSGTTLSFECLDCQAPMVLVASGYGECFTCSAVYDSEKSGEVLDEREMLRFIDPMDPDAAGSAACGDCDSAETVRALEDGWFCVNCFTRYDENEIGQCEWCTEYSSNLPEDSFWGGCTQCEGRAGHHKDD